MTTSERDFKNCLKRGKKAGIGTRGLKWSTLTMIHGPLPLVVIFGNKFSGNMK